MASMDVTIDICFGEDASAPVDLSIDFSYRRGSPAHMGSLTYPGDPGEPPEVEIEKVFWPIQRWDKDRREFVPDHEVVPVTILPTDIYEAIEAHIAEHYNPLEYADD